MVLAIFNQVSQELLRGEITILVRKLRTSVQHKKGIVIVEVFSL